MKLQYLISIAAYMLLVIVVGSLYAKRANKNSDNYFLGGRSLGPWVSAMSAEASDMSGWLLMGLPGLAYWSGLASAGWTAIGLAIGTYLNWLIVSRRLRVYSEKVEAITLPEFFSNRFHDEKNVLLTIASILIIVFFTPYAGSALMACGKLFSMLFGTSYTSMVIISAGFVLVYTFLGGFLAESVSDFMQAIIMVVALITTFAVGIASAGGVSAVIENASEIPGFLSMLVSANPTDQVVGGKVIFGEAQNYGGITIASGLAWGLGYFGMPQVLLRFMAIRSEKELALSRRVATIWVVISLTAAILIGVIGRVLFPAAYLEYGSGTTENIFILMSTTLLPPILAGLVCAGILAASISSADSYMLISASAIAKNVYKGLIRKDASDKQILTITRLILVLITIFAIIVATKGGSVIFTIVDFAWAGLGGTFGPLMLFSLFWKRTTCPAAIAGMVTGGVTVFVWNFFISKLGGIFAIYELLPAFLLSSLVIVVVSLCTKADDAMVKEYEAVCAN